MSRLREEAAALALAWQFLTRVPLPVAVRYAWRDNPENANLVNREKLPASPFRSDTW